MTLLSCDSIQVRYRNGALGVSDVSMTVEGGEVVALLGPNGAGKTTTARAMSGFLRTEGARVVRGRVTLDDNDITNREPHQVVRHGMAFVPERNKVFSSLSVRDNLLSLGRLPSRSERVEQVEEACSTFPVLKDRMDEPAGRLSGGQQQMLAIARARMLRPRVLIIDELTLGLHPSVHPPLFAAVRSIADSGAGVVIVDESADMVLDTADRCYILRGGEVAVSGRSTELRDGDVISASYTAGGE